MRVGERAVLRITRVALFIGWASVVIYVLTGSLPNHSFQPGRRERRRLLSVLPQGWAFFTRNPQEAVDWYYVQRAGRWDEFVMTNTSARNWFGFKKDGRIQNIEMGSVLRQIK